MTARRHLHAFGPLPPPVGGAVVNFSLFLDEVRARAADLGVGGVRVTNTSPGAIRTRHDVTLGALGRQARLLGALARAHLRREPVVLFGSDRQFAASSPALLGLRALGLPVVFKFTGNSLGRFLGSRPPPLRAALVRALDGLTAALCQTRMLVDEVRSFGVRTVVQSPGFRRVSWDALPAVRTEPARVGGLRVVQLGLLSVDKGVHDLLRAVRSLGRPEVTVDLVGSPPEDERSALDALVADTPNARLLGEFRGDTPRMLAGYDTLVLPSFHWGEGHAGVVIEAMAAGIPVLVSRFGALPELVADGANGLLVEARDVAGLAAKLAFLADHPAERFRMGHAHRARLAAHDLRAAVELIVGLLGFPSPAL